MSRFNSDYYKDVPNCITYVIKVKLDVIVDKQYTLCKTLQIRERMPANN